MSISSIGGMSGMSGMQMQGMQGMRQRPDPAQMAENLFSQLDTSGQGYIQKSDLQTAFDSLNTSTSSSSSSSSASVDDVFSQLDSDSDGKVTKQEFTDTMKKLSEQLDQQFQSMRMQDGMNMSGMGGMGGMPPPPPPSDDEGFTEDELTSQLEEIGSSDSQRSTLISSVLENFEAADADSNGKVSFQEAMAYQQSQSSSSTSASSSSTTTASAVSGTTSSSSSSSSSTADIESKVMLQIMKLMHAYSQGLNSTASSSLSVLA